MVNSLFNYNKNTNFKIFDYTKVLPEILSIQCAFRSYQARQKHLLLKYLISRITLIQKMIRGVITRQKFKRLKKCLDLIIRIQSNFRRKMYFTVLKVILIQKWIRKYFVRKKYLRKKQRKENSLINPDDEYYDSSDKEEMRKVIQRKKKREKEKKKENQKKLLENERKKKLNEEAKLYKEKENKKKKLAEKQKKLAMNVKQNLKDSKNQANMFYSFFSDLEQNNNMDKSSSTNNKNISYGIPNKKKIKEENYDIENEKDIDKVIAALLLDKKLMRDNESMNRLLANENGVKKDIRYKLLQLDNPLSKFKKENSNKIITNSNKSSYSNIDVLNNKNKSKEKKVKRIEDKLLDYGKALKQKKAQERVDKLKAEDEQCTFKPNLKKKNFIKSFSNTDFYTRAAKFEEKKEKDLSTLKSKISDRDKNKNEYTFKPKISKNSKKIKRSIDDLYNWNKEKQRKIEEKQFEKQKLLDEEFELNQQTSFINNKSKILLSRKSRESSKNNYNINDMNNLEYMNEMGNNYEEENELNINNNNQEIEFDLWPNYLERKFYDDKEEIPLGNKMEEENQLDFIGNKNEFGENDDFEEEDNDNNNSTNKYNSYNNANNDENENEDED